MSCCCGGTDPCPGCFSGGTPAGCLVNGEFFYYKGGDFNDSTIFARHLTNVNAVTFPAGKVGSGMGFAAASSQYGKRTDTAFTLTGKNFSFAGWVKLASKPGSMAIIDRYASPNGYVLFYDSTNDNYQFWIGDGTNNVAIAGTIGFPSIGTWQHLAATFDATTNTLKLYENGVSVGTQNQPCNGLTDPGGFFALGAGGQGTSNFLDGDLDEWGGWLRVLYPSEAAYHYNSGNGRTWPVAGLITHPEIWRYTGAGFTGGCGIFNGTYDMCMVAPGFWRYEQELIYRIEYGLGDYFPSGAPFGASHARAFINLSVWNGDLWLIVGTYRILDPPCCLEHDLSRDFTNCPTSPVSVNVRPGLTCACEDCPYSSVTPFSWTFTCAGVTDFLCACCTSYNGTFDLVYEGGHPSGCEYTPLPYIGLDCPNQCINPGVVYFAWILRIGILIGPTRYVELEPTAEDGTIYRMPLSAWNSRGSNTIPLITSGAQCQNWPASITLQSS